MIFLTTTAVEIDDELLNRCVVLTVDEEREQTRAIHRIAARVAHARRALGAQDPRQVLKFTRTRSGCSGALVLNPYAERLTFIDANPHAAGS